MAFTFDDDGHMTERLMPREKITPARPTPSRQKDPTPLRPEQSYVEGFRFGGQDDNADAQQASYVRDRSEIVELRAEIQVERKKYEKMRKNVVRLQRRVNILEREKSELQDKLTEIERQRLAVALAQAGIINDDFDLDMHDTYGGIGCAPLRKKHRRKKKKQAAAAALAKSPRTLANDPLERLKTQRGIIGRTTSSAVLLVAGAGAKPADGNGAEPGLGSVRDMNGDAGGGSTAAAAAAAAAAAVASGTEGEPAAPPVTNEKMARDLQRLKEENEDLNNFMTAIGVVFQNIRADLLVQMACSKDPHLSRLATQTLIKFTSDKEKQKELAQAGTIQLLLRKVEEAKTDKQRLAAADALEVLVGNPRLQNYLIQGSEIKSMLAMVKEISDVRLLDYIMGILALCCGNPGLHPTLIREGLVAVLSRIASTERVLSSAQVKRKRLSHLVHVSVYGVVRGESAGAGKEHAMSG
eukprot:jgi/Mesvir1/2857/Mv13944-RA.1